MSAVGRKIGPLSIEWSDFTHTSFYGRNFWICPLIFDMPTSCPAAPVLLSKLISKGYMLYESLQSKPRVAHFNDLLRQQSENAYLKSEN